MTQSHNNQQKLTTIPNGWNWVVIKDITKEHKQGFYAVNAKAKSGDVKYIRITDLMIPKINFDNAPSISVSEKDYESFRINVGDFLIGRSGAIGRYGICYEDRKAIFASYLIRFKFDQNTMLNEYFGELYQSQLISRQLELITQGSSNQNINAENIKSLVVPLPSLSEQKAIVKIIIVWDRGIEALEQLIATKTKLKHTVTQQLLRGRKRFREFEKQEWQRTKISDFAKLSVRSTPKPNKPFKSLGIRSHGKGTFPKEDFEPEKIELTELYEVQENDLIVNITFAWEGAIAIASPADSGALVSHRFPTYVFDTERAIPEYFRHVIIQKWFVEKLGLISPGGAGRNRVLSKKDFAKLEVLMPSVEEQRKIAAVLNAQDREIDLLQKQLAVLKKQKQGLMQKLLTGQIRVKI